MQSVRIIAGKRGQFAVVVLSDGQTTMDVLVFSRAFDTYRNMLKADEMLIFTGRGRKDERSGGMSFVCDEVLTIEQMRVRKGATLKLEVGEGASFGDLSKILAEGVSENAGNIVCEVRLQSKGIKADLSLKNGYAPSDRLLNQLRNNEGVRSARFVY